MTLSSILRAQTFTYTGPVINLPGSGTSPSCYNLNVSGVGIIGTSKGLSQVCFTIKHTSVDELEILLQSPDGTYVPLTIQNGLTGADDYISTCFSATATSPIKFNAAPFTGNFLAEGHLGAVNNGQNADGNWKLCILDRRAPGNAGKLENWSLTFSNNPAPQPPAFPNNCTTPIPPSSNCASAASICDFNGACGSTINVTKQSWTALDDAACFGLNNNTFVTFVAASSTVSFSVWVNESNNGFNNVNGGIQMLFFSTPSCGEAVTTYGCYNRIYPYATANKELINLIYATGLIPGNTYYLMIDGANGDQCDFRIAANSGINALNIKASSQSICLGDSVTLTASGGNGTYIWGANNSNAGLAATSGTVVKAGPSTSGIIRYSLNSTTGLGCPTSTSIDINVSPQPTAPVITPTQPTCTIPSGTITVTAVTGSTYSIDGINYQSSNIFTGLNPGNYNITIKISGGCVSAPSSTTINAVPTGTPTLVYSIIDPTCSNSTGGIVIQQPVGSNYEYNVNGGTYQNSPSISNLTSGNYTITVRDKSTGCVSPASPFTIKTAPVAPIAPTTSVTQPTCTIPTGSVSITNPTGPNMEYSLNGGPYQAAPSFVNLNPGNYTIKVKDNANGCESNVTTFTINAAAAAPNAPTFNPVTQPTCIVPTGSITINSPTGSNIEYSLNGGNYQSSPTFNNLVSGSYTVTARSTPGNCVSSPSVFTINPAPAIPSTPELTITVKATCSNQQGTITITKPSGNNLSYGIDGVYQTSPVFSGLSTGRAYDFTVKNTNSECVSGSSSLSIDPAICNDDLFVPNAFTPNGDGKNDILFVRGTSIRNIQFYVFNQWGERIFESNSLSNGWDGTYKGKKQPVGVYVYVLKAVNTEGIILERKGSVTLIR
jgi:gliding motility-associated-like protein